MDSHFITIALCFTLNDARVLTNGFTSQNNHLSLYQTHLKCTPRMLLEFGSVSLSLSAQLVSVAIVRRLSCKETGFSLTKCKHNINVYLKKNDICVMRYLSRIYLHSSYIGLSVWLRAKRSAVLDVDPVQPVLVSLPLVSQFHPEIISVMIREPVSPLINNFVKQGVTIRFSGTLLVVYKSIPGANLLQPSIS